MTDQADLPQDLLDPECPDCGRILAAPPYTQLAKGGDATDRGSSRFQNTTETQPAVSTSEPAAGAVLSSEPDLMREAVKALEPLRAANIARQAEWDADNQISLTYRATELAGEVGEACNVIKKLERERLGIRGSRATKEQLAEELADVVICADLIAMSEGINLLDEAVPAKFNATSEKYGLATRFSARLSSPAPEIPLVELCIACGGTGKRHRVSQEAMDWAAAQGPAITEERARNPDGIGYKSFQELKEAAGLSSPAPAQEVDPDYTGMFHAPAQERTPGLDWELSDETKAAIAAIEENLRHSAAMAHTLIFGGVAPAQGEVEPASERKLRELREALAEGHRQQEAQPAPAQGEVDVIARLAALTELRRQISTEGRNWFRDRECVGPIDYQGIDIAEIVRVVIAVLQPPQEAQPAPAQGEAAIAWRVKDYADGWICYDSEKRARHDANLAGALLQPLFLHPQQEAQAQSAPQGELGMRERAAQVAEQADEIGPRGYRFETGTLRRIIAAAIRGLAPAPQGERKQEGERTDCNMGYARRGACGACGATATGNCQMSSTLTTASITTQGAPAPQDEDKVGEFHADYSELTAGEIAQPDPGAEVIARSKIIAPLEDEAAVERVARALAQEKWPLATPEERIAWQNKHWQKHIKTARAAIAALHEAAPQAPDGYDWKMVPVEPTEEMWFSGCGVAEKIIGHSVHKDFLGPAWAAMLASAPEPPPDTQKVRQSLAYMRLFTAVRAWMRIRGVGWDSLAAREVKDAMNAIDALSTRPQEPDNVENTIESIENMARRIGCHFIIDPQKLAAFRKANTPPPSGGRDNG